MNKLVKSHDSIVMFFLVKTDRLKYIGKVVKVELLLKLEKRAPLFVLKKQFVLFDRYKLTQNPQLRLMLTLEI